MTTTIPSLTKYAIFCRTSFLLNCLMILFDKCIELLELARLNEGKKEAAQHAGARAEPARAQAAEAPRHKHSSGHVALERVAISCFKTGRFLAYFWEVF
ncbi:hypothetical protein Pyn_13956 [Prunus yedoensis var. nudiflora]|uniref:Uncharacterized protein n=1 Tax=Prunus yedoensis var. nudiflora TaxID=2094558 RepID=A0A314YS50_PRUYE|nr:hypothetical protein Pyn_13956 [Prunus yedoensis var. nudiflora]